MPIEIRELLVEPPDEPETAPAAPESAAMPDSADVTRVVETLQRSRALRADRLRAD